MRGGIPQGLDHRLYVEITLQITGRGPMLEGSGTDRSKVAHFCQRLELLLVAKQSAGSHPLMQARLTLERTGYTLADIQAVAKPDKEVIWLETAQEEIEGSYPRVLARGSASVAVQVPQGDVAQAAAFLSLLDANLASLWAEPLATATRD